MLFARPKISFTLNWVKSGSSAGDGFREFACYAEAVIATEEYAAWARAADVEEYLKFQSNQADFPVVHHDKLARYWSVV